MVRAKQVARLTPISPPHDQIRWIAQALATTKLLSAPQTAAACSAPANLGGS
jgi:hypothetical protein